MVLGIGFVLAALIVVFVVVSRRDWGRRDATGLFLPPSGH